MNDGTVYRLEKDGTRTILAARYDGKKFSGPNDIVIKSDGAVYFTDTPWGLRGAQKDPNREIPFYGFYLIKDGKVTLLGSDKDAHGGIPNGITLSPDEKYLYVTSGGRKTMRYDIQGGRHPWRTDACSSSTDRTACAWTRKAISTRRAAARRA